MDEDTPARTSKPGFPGHIKDKPGGHLSSMFEKLFRYMKPDPVASIGAGWGLAGLVFILLVIMVSLMVDKIGVTVAVFSVLFLTVISALAATGVHYGLKLVNLLPSFYRFVLFAALFALVWYWKGSPGTRMILIAWTLLAGSLLGGVMAVLLTRKWNAMDAGKKVLNIITLAVGAGGLAWGFTWLFMEGYPSDPPYNASLMSDYRPYHIPLADPSMEGDYPVMELTYGSGHDLRREEFAGGVTIKTDSVDGSPFLKNWEKLHGWARTKYWGFDEHALPLNGRVWYPGGEGPFPLVLIVHGNHADRDFSDSGYAYLGRLMASRGFIFASVDENFLNGAWYDLFDNLKDENACRAWILLKHLELWRSWNKDAKTPFQGKVDMDNIGLMGHSRGGEAVAIAACLNNLPRHPDDATLLFHFHFNIKAVIAIAPVDGQYQPAGTGTMLENINYFVIHGSHDMDLRTYEGSRQFHRIVYTGDACQVKAGLYVYGANHGQFNTSWGRNDNTFPLMALFNKRQIMPKEDQEKIAKVFFSAFLEATLHGKKAYFTLFRDYRSGIDWLPETIYLNQYEDPACEFICTFEEDINVQTTTVDEGEIRAENLTVWREGVVPLKWNNQATRAVYAGWDQATNDSLPGMLRIRQNGETMIATNEHSFLYFVMADAKEDPNPRTGKGDAGAAGKGSEDAVSEEKEPMDLTLVLVDADGLTAALPLSDYSYLSRQLEPKLLKADFMNDEARSDLVFQVFFYPLSAFREQNSRLDLTRIREIRFVFDRTGKGVVAIDNIGFWKDKVDAAI
jgi:dienelactone hydrolase